jgi:hypothetical protein
MASVGSSQLADLKGILVTHPGGSKVCLHLTDETQKETVIALGDQYCVNASVDFQNRIQHLFEASSISLE